jgi:hypothetical protein
LPTSTCVRRRRFTSKASSGPSLLIVGADKDHIVPASLSKAQYEKHERSPAQTDYLEFEGRPHLDMIAPDWQEVAAAIDSWLDGVLDAPFTAKGSMSDIDAPMKEHS